MYLIQCQHLNIPVGLLLAIDRRGIKWPMPSIELKKIVHSI